MGEHVYRTETGEPYLRVQKCLDENGKKQYPQAHWDGKQWEKGKPKSAKLPYHLPQLIAAPITGTVYFCEGEKDVDALAKLGFTATTVSEGAGAKWDDALTPHFKDRPVVILPDADLPGRAHAHKVAKAINGVAASVRVLDLYPDRHDGSDVSDWLTEDTAGARLAKLSKEAPLWEPSADDGNDERDGDDNTKRLIAELAALPRLAYEKQREGAAKQIGVRVSVLDEIVEAARAESDEDGIDGLGLKQADVLIALTQAAGLFHTPSGDGYADVTVMGHRETYRVRSKSFRSWLAHRYFEARNGAPSSEAMSSALGVIEARALFEGPEITVHVRVAGHAGKLYLDLADSQWRAVEIDADGWRVISSPPVRFRRAPGMLPLPEPVGGGSINSLRPLLNVRDEDSFILAVAWLLGALRDHGPYPVLVLSGEHGTAKSTLCGQLRALIDPNTAPLRALPREDRDLFIAANNGHVLAFDNISGLPAWISDTLCRLATGGGFSVRQLYTDDSETLFDAMRPSILNGIEDVVTRPDLTDRALMLRLEPIPEAERRLDQELRAKLDSARPSILGALLDALVCGQRRLPDVKLKKLPRMADFALWVAACEPALWSEGTFATAYEANREETIGGTIEADLVAAAVRALMADRESPWTGTASGLLDTLGLLITETQRRSKGWPTTTHHLSGRLRRAAPVLRKIGVGVEQGHTNKGSWIRITRIVQPSNLNHSSST